MLKGVVIKAYGGYYYVHDGKKTWKCRLRGRFRIKKQKVLVGDRVTIIPLDESGGVIEELLPRRNELIRPPVANVDVALIVLAVKEPDPDLFLLDRMLVLVENAGVKPVICCNKIDLIGNDTERAEQNLTGDQIYELLDLDWLKVYRDAGYSTVAVSAKQKTGIKFLKSLMVGRISLLAGPSGVGKSSLLNAMQPGFSLKTGTISKKLKRGRHVTRHVELLTLDEGGLVADTPGFSSSYLPQMHREELQEYFPEINKLRLGCRFKLCLHFKEPDCAVKSALESGKIASFRYQHYLDFLQEIIDQERRF